MDGKTEITLTLTLEEVNLVLQALGGMPYAQVFTQVEKIKGQAQRQVEDATQSAAN